MTKTEKKTPASAATSRGFRGSVTVPGDKSISHRALIIGGLTVGSTTIKGLLRGEDVTNTLEAIRASGAKITDDQEKNGTEVCGAGFGTLREPENVLDFGNSGTGARLTLGAYATNPSFAVFTGDASLRRRPMERVAKPLRLFGAEFLTREGGRLPLAVKGAFSPKPARYVSETPSAQVKSAFLLAALAAPGISEYVETIPTRDHTERMLKAFGADITVTEAEEGGKTIAIRGQTELTPQKITVPADPSSAAFLIVAALIIPESEITIRNVLLNPGRTGLFDTLKEMGADLEIVNQSVSGDEPVGDLVARSSRLKGVTVPAERAPSMIDEYPILAIAAAVAEGETKMLGLSELRAKESDRLAAIAAGLKAIGVTAATEDNDTLIVKGGKISGGATVETHADHRIAMSFLTAGCVAESPIAVDDVGFIDTSFPGFVSLMRECGAHITIGA